MLRTDTLSLPADTGLPARCPLPASKHGDSPLFPPITPPPPELDMPELVEGLPPEEVHRRALIARKSFAQSFRALWFWLLDMEKRQLYRHFGASSVYHYGEQYLELAPHTIAELLRTGKALENLPKLAKACGEGSLAPSKAREISRVAVPETEDYWLEVGTASRYREVEKLVAATPKGGLPRASRKAEAPASSRAQEKAAGHISAAVCNEGTRGGAPEASAVLSSDSSKQTACVDELSVNLGSEAGRNVGAAECCSRGAPAVEDSPLKQMCEEGEGSGAEPVGPSRFRSKLVVEVEGDQMAVIQKALEKARKRTGMRDRAELLEYIARSYLQSAESSTNVDIGAAPFRIHLYSIPESQTTWVEGPTGRQYVSQSVLEQAMCDAEILDLRGSPCTGSCTSASVCEESSSIQDDPARDCGAATVCLQDSSADKCEEGRELDSAFQDKQSEKGGDAGQACCKGEIAACSEERAGRSCTCEYDDRTGPKIRKVVSHRLRRKVIERQWHRCACCGCMEYLEIHHLDKVCEGGKNFGRRLCALCWRCHRAIHEGRLQVEGDGDSLVWRNSKGELLKT